MSFCYHNYLLKLEEKILLMLKRTIRRFLMVGSVQFAPPHLENKNTTNNKQRVQRLAAVFDTKNPSWA